MTILIAYDGSEEARDAIEFAAKHVKAESAVVLTVWEPLLVTAGVLAGVGPILEADEVERDTQAFAEKTAKDGADLALASGFQDATPRAASDVNSVWSTIVDTAEEIDATLIVTGSRGLSAVKSVLLGSVSNNVLHHAHRPTLVVPKPASK